MRPGWVAELLASRAADTRPAHTYLGADGSRTVLTRDALLVAVRHRAAALRRAGVQPADRVVLTTEDPARFVPAFLGAVWLGAVPVALAPPPPIGRRDAWRQAAAELLAAVRPRLVCALPAEAALLGGGAPLLPYDVLGVPAGAAPDPLPSGRAPDTPVYLQFSSGATGAPKAVAVTEAGLRANCDAIATALAFNAGIDRGVTWLPLHHDMGLVGFVLAPLTAGVPVVFLPTTTFVRDPGSWLRAVAAERGTITFAPNFALALAARHAERGGAAAVAGLDLSAVRVLGCGAEPIDPGVLRRFVAAYRPAGLDPAALVPAYGLAEATLAVTFDRREGPHRVDRIDPAGYYRSVARPATVGADGIEVVNCGYPVPGVELSVVDTDGAPVPERAVGEIWVRGPSVVAPSGPDGWLRTGDLGYLAGGALHVTGRRKDLLMVRGRNIDPQRLEWLVETLPGARGGGAAAFTRNGSDTEEVIVVVECRAGAAAELSGAVRKVAAERLGLAIADVVPVRPGTVPKTSSGKLRRTETRRRYLAGGLSLVDA